MTGVKLTHVPYRGSAPALTDMIAGQVQVLFDNPSSISTSPGQAARVAVTTDKRSDALPDVPTVAETVPGYEASAWFGMGAPKGTRPGHCGAQQDDQRGDLPTRTSRRGSPKWADAMGGTPAEFGKIIADADREVKRWSSSPAPAWTKAGVRTIRRSGSEMTAGGAAIAAGVMICAKIRRRPRRTARSEDEIVARVVVGDGRVAGRA